MPTYLDRYLNGQHEAVWAELTALGPAIRQEPLFADAQAVARETMTRARANVETLVQRLTTLGYHFISDALGTAPTPYIPPDADALDEMRELERQYGALPLSITTWYEVVGAVDFTGSYPRLSAYDELDPSNITMSFQGQLMRVSLHPEFRILGPAPDPSANPDASLVSDPLVIWPCIDALVDESEDGRYSLGFAPDALHKANTSGGGGSHIDFGDPRIDAPLQGDDWEGVPFVSYLRTVFAWGGFPGLRDTLNPPHDLLASLTAGLLPL
jgi:hypothetical protein